jgi:hypothetical protein
MRDRQRARNLIGTLFLLTALGIASLARGELVSLEIHQREPFAGGMTFGQTGAYDILRGVARFAIDPANERNKAIVDLELAPRNAAGKVEFASDVCLLVPHDKSKANGAILYDVNNRGNKLALRFFNFAPGENDPTTAEHAGDGFLMRRGYTIVWSGWIGDLLPGAGRMLLAPPRATDNGQPIRGIVRYEIETDAAAETMPISRREGHGSYPLTERGLREATLTWRMRPDDARVPIPREQWSLETTAPAEVEQGVAGTLSQIRMRLAGGFRPGYLYEMIAEAEGPIVHGVCYASVRDLVSFLRYDSSDRNPLVGSRGTPIINRAHGFGVSQSGRFLKNFVYLDFNSDEQGRKVFDGLMPHVAGGGLGFFNHRFAQPTRHNNQHMEHLYPGDYFPFTYGESTDPYTKRTDGILRRAAARDERSLPRIMHTQGAGEYWSRSGSLVHTDPLSSQDAVVPDNVRIYSFGGTQHSAAAEPLTRGTGENLLNPADYRPFLKGLLDALDAWVRDGATPPESVYPRIDQAALVDFRQKSTGFPALPGVRYPEVIQQPHALDYGPDFLTKGIISIEPPRRIGDYRVRVPKCGPDGNELGTLLVPDVAVPLATFTGWNLRRAEVGAEGMLVGLMGSFLPLPRTSDERQATGDPRESLQERYGSFDRYRRQYAGACDELVEARYLLREDADKLVAERQRFRELFEKAAAAQ